MTYKKYIRLTALVIVPLGLLGWSLFGFVPILSYEPNHYILCTPGFLNDEEVCRNVDLVDTPSYNWVHNQYDVWFDVNAVPYSDRKSEYLQFFVRASSFMVAGRIVDDQAFAMSSPERVSFTKSLVGKNAIVNLGYERGKNFLPTDALATLYCYDLTTFDLPKYSATCWVDQGGGGFKIEILSIYDRKMEMLQAEILKRMQEVRREYLLFRVIMYPLFIYLFFLISAVVWLVRRSVVFINGGEYKRAALRNERGSE